MSNVNSRPYPLGATLCDQGCNFSIHAPDSSNLSLVLFDEDNNKKIYKLKNNYSGIRHIFIEGIKAGQKYGYMSKIHGEEWILIDPYAYALDKAPHYKTPYSAEKSWQFCKAVVTDTTFDWQETTRPRIPLHETLLFETHAKGFTKQNPNVSAQHQGTYLGLADPANIAFLKSQGITTIQLLPVAACMHEPHLLNMDKVNYWGYNPLTFMAPDPRYANEDAVVELKTAIRELHRNGIEVVLDVVFNHTAESGDGGPIFNLKALDKHYYLQADHHHINYTGCGNTVDMTHQASINLVMDSLRHWVNEYHIDGFRFDLAATLGRKRDHFDMYCGFFKAVAQDPTLRQTKLIAEPWDIGPDGYQLGYFPDGWNECNDKFRDSIRSFWRGDKGYLKEFATRIMGSRDLFSAGRWPQKLTVNYISYHDGYTLQDLVSYKQKHNEANGEENRDGHGDNRSDNYGVEGETNRASIIAIREKQKRNLITTLLFSFGIPHLLASDSLSHTQGGNNNAYCQDNEISWPSWELTETQQAFKQWLADMIQARKQWMIPFIESFSGEGRGHHRIQWLRPSGDHMVHDDWHDKECLALHMGLFKQGDELLLLVNQSKVPSRFTLPNESEQEWVVICDTNDDEVIERSASREYLLPPVSMAVLRYKAPITKAK
ncbi:glycogen debranching protein GlgX [Vibrio sp. Of7-15]|uniref:glycogen debranching protein GlgX n=1 Tax=Vibrio sp. Of7-15 TaxID=2724879 RepID=UPI001EF1F349|nr:glycogen debranching protein GlgX [Vibrio sp. Of7-15]MCG7495256.1 glycogen debranching protein GlgX [Vibrio sp. Of7-15]